MNSNILLNLSKLNQRIFFYFARNVTSEQLARRKHKSVKFLTKELEISLPRCVKLFRTQGKLLLPKTKELEKSIHALYALKYQKSEILENPHLMVLSSTSIRNRYQILQEIGYENIPIGCLTKYVQLANKSIKMHKQSGLISSKVNVADRLTKCFNDQQVILGEITEHMSINNLRRSLLNIYLKQKLGANENDLAALWKTYPRIKHRSFESITSVIHILQSQLNFSNERILKNGFTLYADPKNISQMIEKIPLIGDKSIDCILYRRPKILMIFWDSIIEILGHIKSFGIPETSVNMCLELLTLSPDTVLERLQSLHEVEEFQVLTTNPRVLWLVQYYNKAKLRLAYLNQLNLKCASLHILSTYSGTFERFARDGCDRSKGRDLVIYLSHILNQSIELVRESISRHPNWCHISLVPIKKCFDFLQAKNFTLNDIFNNIQILLYPIKSIEEKLQYLESSQIYQDFGLNSDIKINDAQRLGLCLYLIEEKYHFTGDGVWNEQHEIQIENFNQVIPDFPQRLSRQYKYKYGAGPAAAKLKLAVAAV